jgi:hypothetical protein
MTCEIIEHHKGRKSIDHSFLHKLWERDDREALQRMIEKSPNEKHRYPTWSAMNYAYIGYSHNTVYIRKDLYG